MLASMFQLVSHVILKILHTRHQQYVNQEIPYVPVGFRKGGGTRDQIANICWIIEKAQEFQKYIYFCFIYWLCQSFWLCRSQKIWEILKELGIPDHLTFLLRNLYAGQEQQLELDMEQQTGTKLRKKYIKAVYCHPAYLLICRVHHEKRWAGWSTSWNQDCWEKYQ